MLVVLIRIQKLEEEMEGSEEKGKLRKGKGEEEVKRIERPTSLIQDMSDPFEDFPHTQPFDCINITQSTSHPEAWTFVCVNNPEFNDIAREVYEKKAWETWLSEHLVQAMVNYPEAIMLDIGSNIGPHSLTVAAMEREVVVLDAVFYNLALILQSHLRTGKGKVRILYNSISNVQGEQLYPYLEARHRHMAGATYLVSRDALDSARVADDGIRYTWEEVIGPPAVSVTTADVFATIEAKVVIIKIDVEGHECKALTKEVLDQSLGKFVPYIFMEWANLRLNRHHTCDEYSAFLNSFTSSGYLPHTPGTLVPVSLDSHTDWFDVVWIHEKAKKILV